ncbi:hypothetical protein BF93_17360 [Brachybacterium phenoliresistens]|uniref:DUF3375 domain-containing protein n=1 Tax=Brachybacterium phenoliresistens TaxID=396014 RepID=Z9JSH5_9MICO|nr:DUF3375 domain-containing protein [Brachybacterium phenoliresistens]EWS81330.1 hypothetical protein BF93_17360 [Brachybacterium phenoliresistens]
MTGLSRALQNRELMEDSGPLRLLRTEHAPYTLGLLAEHLGGERRVRTAAELYDLLDADLEELRLHGVDLPRTAQQYCATWVAQGFLTRRAARTERTEEFSLTEHAHAALRILDQVHAPRDAVTRSRLALLTDRLRALAQETDPDTARRIAALEAERQRIDQLIDSIRERGAEPLPQAQAVEAAEELYSLALDVPSDFTRVRGELERLHRKLRLDLVEHDGPQGEILDQLFLGVDAIEDSDAGRSFAAFHALLIDPVQEARFHEAVDALASRPFAATLGPERVLFLQSYLTRLQRDSHQVRQAMIDLSRSLREFVRSRQFEEFRALADRLRRPQRLGLAIAPHVRPHTRLGMELTLSTFTPRSVGQFRLLSPGESTAADPLDLAPTATLDLEALRATIRESEIDLAELEAAVDAVLAEQPSATIGEVLAAHPATQGLASVVGLVVLAQRHGEPVPEEGATELVTWQTRHVTRAARLPTLRFTHPLRENVHD